MASVSITTPTSDSTVTHTFPAGGAYDIADLDEGEIPANTVRSVVTQSGQTLDTQTYTIPSRSPSGAWAVQHSVAGSGTLTGCVVTATLVVNGTDEASAAVTNITISG